MCSLFCHAGEVAAGCVFRGICTAHSLSLFTCSDQQNHYAFPPQTLIALLCTAPMRGPTRAWKGAGWDARRAHDAYACAQRIPIPCKWACKLICHRKMLPRDRSRLARWVGRGGSAFPACTCAPPAAHPDAKLAASPCRWRARHDASRACTAREARQTHRGVTG